MKINCKNCVGKILVPEDAVVGDFVFCPDCGRDFAISKKDSSGIQLMRPIHLNQQLMDEIESRLREIMNGNFNNVIKK